MSEIVIFGGTVEGRELAVRLRESGENVTVCVTSEYARALLPKDLPCRVGALDFNEMTAFLKNENPKKVVDCTHPYAVRATANIRACCGQLKIPCERVERQASEGEWVRYVERAGDTLQAARALSRTEGNVLLTTGSHTLKSYTDVIAPARIWVRVLPSAEALRLCAEAGVAPAHIIAMQGPFSAAFNAALYDMLNIRVMVTKDSGAQGGVAEKVVPALESDIHVILIERPKET